MRGRTRHRLDRDDGFTIVELVISVAILGVVTVALVGVVLAYLRHTVDTQARLTESHAVQFAAAYWQRDVASIGVRSATYDSTTHSFPLEQSVGGAPCPLPAGATEVVTLAWSEYTSLASTDPATRVTVTYATAPDGAVLDLVRVRCGSEPSTVTVADSLSAAPTLTCEDVDGNSIACTGAGADVPAVVKLGLTVSDSEAHHLDAYTATLAGERRQS